MSHSVVDEPTTRKDDKSGEDDLLILPLWYGNPGKDILKATEWIVCFERAKQIFKLDDSTTFACVENALVGDSHTWFLTLLKKV